MAPIMLPKRVTVNVTPIVPNKRKKEDDITLTREKKYEKELYEAFHNSQLTVTSDNLKDVKLICEGGTISVHAMVLAVVSKFLLAALESQGDNYLSTRVIILPEVPVKEMQKAMQIVYTGSAYCHSEEEADSLNELLTSLQIESRGNIVTRKSNKKKVEEDALLIRVNLRKKVKTNPEPEPVKPLEELSTDEEEDKKDANLKTRFGRTVKQIKRKRNYNDSDFEPTTDDEGKEQVAKKSPRVSVLTPTKGSKAKPAVAAVISATKKTKTGKNDADNADEPDYTNKEWFNREINTCQVCKKVYDNTAAVSSCFNTHGKLRCYFCFGVFKNTEKLFEHFRHGHKQAGRDKCLLCPYCEQTIPFKSVSTHVISLHLSDLLADEKSDDKGPKKTPATPAKVVAVSVSNRSRTGPGRSAAAVKAPTSSEVPDVINKVDKDKSKKPDKESRTAGKKTSEH